MSASRRVQRVERELREIIGLYLLTGLKVSLSGMVTLTRVSVSPDLRIARAFVTIISPDISPKMTPEMATGLSAALSNELNKAKDLENNKNIDLLNSSTRDLQNLIHKQLPMKYCPKVRFEIDKGFDNVQIVEQRLREISLESNQATHHDIESVENQLEILKEKSGEEV